MNTGCVSLAKITKPRLGKVLPRQRLFRLLTDSCTCPATWISGPCGSGKTTVIASYIEERRLPHIWYQVDEADADIATFFYYLGLAGKNLVSEGKDLPLLTPEYAVDLSAFTREFFESLFERLKKPGVLVFDNYQAVPTDCRLQEVIGAVLPVIPEEINLFILSRTRPPSSFARARASNLLYEIGWPALRLRTPEIKELAAILIRTPLSDDVIDKLNQKVDGWMVGLLLLLKQAETDASIFDTDAFTRFTAREMFDYFSSEILDKADKEARDFLLTTSLFPSMCVQMAQQLTGADNAKQILSKIHQNHWFTERYPGKKTTYQYHPMFREYLLDRAAHTYPENHLKTLKKTAARLLAADGQAEAAIGLFFESGNQYKAMAPILDQAPLLTGQGRSQTLMQWLERLSYPVICAHSQLLYWLCVCRHRILSEENRKFFEKAFSIFEARQETAGMCISLCGIIDAIIFDWNNFNPLDQWIPRLNSLSEKYEELPSSAIKGQLTASAFAALTFRQPDHPGLRTWERRGQAVIKEEPTGFATFRLIVAWIRYLLFAGDLTGAGYFISLYRDMAQSQKLPPHLQCILKNLEVFYYFLTNDGDKCRQMADEALDHASANEIHSASAFLLGHRAANALSAFDLDSAGKDLQRMTRYASLAGWTLIYFNLLNLWKALLEKDVPKALFYGEFSVQYVDAAGMIMNDAIWHQGIALAWHAAGKPEKASEHLEQALSIASRTKFRQIEFGCYLIRAEFALTAGDQTAVRDSLQKAMAIGNSQQYLTTWFWRSDAMTTLCCKALEENIEVAYVQKLIRRRNLICDRPPLEIEHWPWPVRIYTLGRFSLIKNGNPVSLQKKSREKPIALLKTIIALGGRDVSENQIADLLWPEADGDAARGAFRTTLHRLRNLLGCREAVVRNLGHITLDPKYCWVDTWVFERSLSTATARWQAATTEKELQTAAELTENALAYYKGPLFQSDDDQPLVLRDHLHHRFIQMLQQVGEFRQKRKQWDRAIALYETGLKIDELAEPFYRGLMSCNWRDPKTNVLATYNRCKKVLAKKLNARPSPETEALKKSLLNK